MPDLSIIIVTYNSEKDIRPCLNSIAETKGGLAIELFVVDNNSRDNTVAAVRNEYPAVRLIANDTNTGFPGASNQAIVLAQGRYILLLNPDTVVHPGALQAMMTFMEKNPDCGACGPVLEDQSGNVIPDLRRPTWLSYLLTMIRIDRLFSAEIPARSLEIISGVSLLIRKTVLEKVGLLDPNLFWCEDVDYCVRVKRQGYCVCKIPEARITHLYGQSAKSNIGLKMYAINASLIGFAHKHSSTVDRLLLFILITIEIGMRLFKWWITSLISPSDNSIARKQGLMRVMKDLPILFQRRHWSL